MPRVSVLTPIYNTNPQYLRECIESILNQTYTDFEFLILNDSPDNTEIESVVKEAGLTIDSYNSYRRHGNLPRADEAVKIAKALNTTVEFLVTGENSTPKPDTTKIIQTIESALEQAKNL